jgi:hypothetical protein
MKCDRCGAWSEVVETRAKDEGLRTERRRRCANGHLFGTTETHRAVYCSAKPRQQAFAATVAGRWARWQRDAQIRRDLAAGATLDELAAKHGVSRSLISLIGKS